LIKFDRENNARYIKLNNNKIVDSEEIENGFIIDLDKNDEVVGIEILYLNELENNLIIPLANINSNDIKRYNIFFDQNRGVVYFWHSTCCMQDMCSKSTISFTMKSN